MALLALGRLGLERVAFSPVPTLKANAVSGSGTPLPTDAFMTGFDPYFKHIPRVLR